MESEWYIGTMRDADFVVDLAVPITRSDHEALREAEKVIREALGGMLFRLVFANHRALQDVEARMLEQLTRPDRQGFAWGPNEGIQLTLALANWLTSVRWLLDHTLSRLHDEPERLKRVQAAMNREFDGQFAYRFTYKLRDYVTHCDLPPISIHVSSKMVGPEEREDSLSLQLIPEALLAAWDGWKSHVKNDLTARTEPIDLIPLVDEAMESIERVMMAIIAEDVPRFRAASQRVVDAVDRLPADALEAGAAPIVAEVDAGTVRTLSPTPLPIAEARDILKQSAHSPEADSG